MNVENTQLPEGGPLDGRVRAAPERAAFEAWARTHRRDLDLTYMYDADGNYHHDGYIWADAGDAFRLWCAAADASRERGGEPLPAATVQKIKDTCDSLGLDIVAFAWRVQKAAWNRA